MRTHTHHACLVPGCPLVIRQSLTTSRLMCPAHWRRVPADLRRAVLDTYRVWRSDDGAPYLEFWLAQRDAIRAVEGGAR